MTAEVSAPPMPCTKRAPISRPWLFARPHRREATGEDRQPDHEHPLAADQVAEAPGQHQQASEGDQVGVDDPGELRLREVQVGLYRRQRHVHDRRVEDDHEEARADHD